MWPPLLSHTHGGSLVAQDMHGVKGVVTQTSNHLVNQRGLYAYQNYRPIVDPRSDL